MNIKLIKILNLDHYVSQNRFVDQANSTWMVGLAMPLIARRRRAGSTTSETGLGFDQAVVVVARGWSRLTPATRTRDVLPRLVGLPKRALAGSIHQFARGVPVMA